MATRRTRNYVRLVQNRGDILTFVPNYSGGAVPTAAVVDGPAAAEYFDDYRPGDAVDYYRATFEPIAYGFSMSNLGNFDDNVVRPGYRFSANFIGFAEEAVNEINAAARETGAVPDPFAVEGTPTRKMTPATRARMTKREGRRLQTGLSTATRRTGARTPTVKVPSPAPKVAPNLDQALADLFARAQQAGPGEQVVSLVVPLPEVGNEVRTRGPEGEEIFTISKVSGTMPILDFEATDSKDQVVGFSLVKDRFRLDEDPALEVVFA